MNKISVAIPTYISSRFVNKCISSVFKVKNVDEIIIHDDSADDNEYLNLVKIVSKYQKKNGPEIRLYRNKSNLGGFKNKYLAVQKCKNDIIYQIDSDNIASNNFSDFLNNMIENFDQEMLYTPSSIYVFKKNYYLTKLKKNTLVEITPSDLILDLIKVQNEILNKTLSNKSMDWVLNLGNHMFQKDSYLEKLEEGFESKQNTSAGDAIAGTYYWLKNGGSIYLLNNFTHHHRLRRDGYFANSKEEGPKVVEQFIEKITNLK